MVKATPQQNGVSKRLNRTLAEGVIAMLNQANLPMSLWAYAVLYYTDILNCTPSLSVSNATSYEVWHGRKPDLSPYHTFGCQAFVNIHRKERKNLASHTDPCIFVGFEEGYKGWRCYNSTRKTTLISRDVIFDETSFPGLSTKTNPVTTPLVGIRDIWPYDDDIPPATDAVPKPPHPKPPPATYDSSSSSDSGSSHEDNDNEDPKVPTPVQAKSPPRRQRPSTPPPKQAPITPPVAKRPAFAPKEEPSPTPCPPSTVVSPPSSPEPEVPIPAPVFQPAPIKWTRSKDPPLVAQGNRPIHAKVTDYTQLLGMRRRGTQPVARRDVERDVDDFVEQQDITIGSSTQGGASTSQVADRGGAWNINPPPITAEDYEGDTDDEPTDIQAALRATPILNSVLHVYGLSDEYITFADGREMALNMAVDAQSALGAATRPEDSPHSWKEAMRRYDSDKWIEAAQAEIDALTTNGTWELVQLPEDRKAIGSRWVFLIKRKSDGTIDCREDRRQGSRKQYQPQPNQQPSLAGIDGEIGQGGRGTRTEAGGLGQRLSRAEISTRPSSGSKSELEAGVLTGNW